MTTDALPHRERAAGGRFPPTPQARCDLHTRGVSWGTGADHVRMRHIKPQMDVVTPVSWSCTCTRGEAAGCTIVPGGSPTGVGTAEATRALEEVSVKSSPAPTGGDFASRDAK
jgi:hypothetical protein